MQTSFSLVQLADPAIAEADQILRACVHCGFCTATCPTYVLLGDERDSPRGRIYLIKDMLENDRPAEAEEVVHIDRCLSCLSCMTTCPSGVHYMHLVDHARAHVEQTYRRPFADRVIRFTLARVLPNRSLFRLALFTARLGRPFAPFLEKVGLRRIGAMLRLAPATFPTRAPHEGEAVLPASGERRFRVALMRGCANEVLAPQINAAAIRVLNRHGVEVVQTRGEGCCGALVHHLGHEADGLAHARRNIDSWTREIERGGLDAILITASGCGTTVKDYGHMLRNDNDYSAKAARVSALAKDISEFLSGLSLAFVRKATGLGVAYHAACSLQHGQRVLGAPKTLLRDAGFLVREPAEAHLCCGSAGSYNMLQPVLATQLRDRKVAAIERLGADVIATGNIGCMVQIGQATSLPVVHTVELLDWMTGGPQPETLKKTSNHVIAEALEVTA